jgi:glycosyltransferase involved in cell wall biosynthesis
MGTGATEGHMEAPKYPKLSIVVTAYTTERINDIYEMLDSIKGQTYADIETIFVIERSEELLNRVNDYVKQKGIAQVKPVFDKNKLGLSRARNLGVANAEGEIVAFIDDDVILFPDWAEETVKAYENESVIGVTGPGLPMWEDEKMSWLPKEMYWIVSATAFTGWTEERAVRSAWGMNMSFRREAFAYCLFSPDCGQTTGGKEAWKAGPVDDADFSINLRLKTRKLIMYMPQVKVYHKVYKYRLSSKFIRGQCYWQGYSKGLLKRRYPHDADTKALVREFDLLQRILFGLIPRSLLALLSKPKLAGKQLSLTSRVLFFVALGYSSGTYPRLLGFTQKHFRS